MRVTPVLERWGRAQVHTAEKVRPHFRTLERDFAMNRTLAFALVLLGAIFVAVLGYVKGVHLHAQKDAPTIQSNSFPDELLSITSR